MLLSTLLRVLATAYLCLGSSWENFTYNERHFLLGREPFQIIGGQMDPQRIPQPYWRQRLQMARAMGLNTIFSSVFWNKIEPAPGKWDFSGNNDIVHFFRLAQDQGLKLVLRPGPYIGGERDWGGLPAWLSQISDMKIRQNGSPFLEASRRYIARLGKELHQLQATHGGPIVMVQLEHKYGSFGNDKEYLQSMANIFRASFDVPLYTTDNGGRADLEDGTLNGVLAATDGDARGGFSTRDDFVIGKSILAPRLAGGYYLTWFDNWSPASPHRHTSRGSMDRTTSDLAWVLSGEDSFNIYMFHGGTNWGFDNGAVWSGDRSLAVTTSYDYGAPLDESGRPTELYHQIRETIAKHVPAGSIPHVPAVPRLIQTGDIVLKPVLSLFDMLPKQPMIESAAPVPMEHMDQSYGFVLYQHTVEEEAEGILFVGDGPRDRVLVYQNGHRVGIIDGTYSSPGRVRVRLNEGDLLQLLVENLGRVDKGHKFEDQRKGIVGNVTVGTRQTLERWKTYSLPLTKLPRGLSRGDKVVVFHRQSPMFYTGSFRLAENAQPGLGSDMFLSIDKAIKGQVWVNGVNLGRYWAMGPQQSLYLPGCYLNAAGRSNKIVVLELEPEANRPMVAKGLSSREWFNRPDPDSVV